MSRSFNKKQAVETARKLKMTSIACGIACSPAGGNPAAIEYSIKMLFIS